MFQRQRADATAGEREMKRSKAEILALLEPMFAQAKNEGLWFRSNSQEIVFSPRALREEHKKGRFIWGQMNWVLIKPKLELERLKLIEAKARLDVKNFEAQIKRESER